MKILLLAYNIGWWSSLQVAAEEGEGPWHEYKFCAVDPWG